MVYLLRSPEEQVSPALFAADDREAVVIRLDQVGLPSSSRLAEIVSPGRMKSLSVGQALTAPELLEVLVNAGKIVTL